MVRASTMSVRGTFQVPAKTTDDYGDPQATTWADLANGQVWGEVMQLTGREAETAHLIDATATHQLSVRHADDLDTVKAGHRYRFTRFGTTRSLNIVARDDLDYRKSQVRFLCKEEAV